MAAGPHPHEQVLASEWVIETKTGAETNLSGSRLRCALRSLLREAFLQVIDVRLVAYDLRLKPCDFDCLRRVLLLIVAEGNLQLAWVFCGGEHGGLS